MACAFYSVADSHGLAVVVPGTVCGAYAGVCVVGEAGHSGGVVRMVEGW